jgi:hypothetical protein
MRHARKVNYLLLATVIFIHFCFMHACNISTRIPPAQPLPGIHRPFFFNLPDLLLGTSESAPAPIRLMGQTHWLYIVLQPWFGQRTAISNDGVRRTAQWPPNLEHCDHSDDRFLTNPRRVEIGRQAD